MKLRIKGNTIRYRLTKAEVEQLKTYGEVSEQISFGPGKDASQTLRYTIQQNRELEAIGISFIKGEVCVELPRDIFKGFTETEQVSLQNDPWPGATQTVFILVEKDFQCLHKRPNEDETDHYQHPLAEENPIQL
ncbi:hypothetical protein J8281_02350 [Aquimarina sp. U1-2]|uniref:DUF7009 family protein n=1 Tax=Aquimarina sp. U1-2 TaxID=2823141 RepID=UPI001AECDC12|nr:hypothetical protein [Aquimarina sp. U1-2]MBP2831016.1 hypothetical protein [Aquimarina sp. U1-2]